MAGKRKARGAPFGSASLKRPKNDDSRLVVNSFEDVMNSEDEFHQNRDEIKLVKDIGHTQGSRLREEDDFLEPSDEEVLAESEEVSSSADDTDGSEEDTTYTKIDPDTKLYDKKRRRDDESSSLQEDEEPLNDWGSSKKDYYDADPVETEADALEEEAEARRLQQKQLQKFTEADFGLDEIDWQGASTGETQSKGYTAGGVLENLPQVEVTNDMGSEERLKVISARYPEFVPLAHEFSSLTEVHGELSARFKSHSQQNGQMQGDSIQTVSPSEQLEVSRYRALTAYMACLAFYFALLSSAEHRPGNKSTIMPPNEIREHSIMEYLLGCKTTWEKLRDATVEDLRFPTSSRHSIQELNIGPSDVQAEKIPQKGAKAAQSPQKVKKSRRKMAKNVNDPKVEAEALRMERLREAEQSFAGLSALTSRRLNQVSEENATRPEQYDDSGSDFGDQTSLTALEAADKARHKKSLRFYTSQIAQKSKKRDEAGRGATGDTDLPHKESRRDQQRKLLEQTERKNEKENGRSMGAMEDDSPSQEEEVAMSNKQRDEAREARDGSEDRANGSSEDYYDLVVQKAVKKKKAAAAIATARDTENEMSRGLQLIEGEGNAIGAGDGKRGLTYAIAKNKGLHQHRKKEVRNPRVKKRKRFEDKKKKLRSVRPVYKNEREGRGGYGGEKTGINRGLVKSVKL